MYYSWRNDDLWQIRINHNDFDDFEQPYIGNGILGFRFDKLIAGTGEKPLYVISRAVYDDGNQLYLPECNHIGLQLDGVSYKPENGQHNLEQVLDLRNAVVSMRDNWEYKSGKSVCVEIEMFVPRTFGNASYISVSVKNLTETAIIRFGLNGKGLTDFYDMEFSEGNDSEIVGRYLTKIKRRQVSQALKYSCSGLREFKTKVDKDEISVSADSTGQSFKLELFHSVGSYTESSDTYSDALKKVKMLYESGRDSLMDASSTQWKNIWKHGIAFRNKDFEWEKSIIVHQFYLLCSLEVTGYPFGPLGLSKIEWGGLQLWDADFWLFRAILPLWPDFAKSFINYRRECLEGAKNHARSRRFKGAWYGWMTTENGDNITPLRYNDELHVNVWIALAAWEYYVLTGDEVFLRDTSWPIISEIADFFVSRSELEIDGYYHINFVIGPDEAVCENGCYGLGPKYRVDDNFLTNFGVKRLLENACKCAEILGQDVKIKWNELKEKIYLLKPNSYGIIPEYEGYNDEGIKQADVILAFYPLGYDAGEDIIRKNISFYANKQLGSGPTMTSQIESCILMGMGEKEAGLNRLFRGIKEFTRGAHYILFECRDIENDNSIMLTAIGGELQALIYGYYGAALNSMEKIPRLAQYMD